MTGWPQVALSDLFRVKHGFAFRSEHFSVAPGPIVLTPGNFEASGGLKFKPEKDRSYTGPFPPEFRLQAGDLLVVMTDLTQEASILGSAAFVPHGVEVLHNQRLGKIVQMDTTRLDLRYLYYVLNGRPVREALKSTATGSTVRHTSPSRIGECVIPLPPLDTQRRIAGVLGAYDDLIDVNRRRVAVLEAMARGLFEEWFVRFRFPGHEDVPLHDTPNGPLPEGWTWGTAGDLLAFDPRTPVPAAGEKPFIPMGSLDTSTSIISPIEERPGNAGAKFRNGDTLFARITPCLENGKTGIVRGLTSPDGVGFGSTEFIVMRAARAGSAFAYCLARLPEFRRHAEGGMSGASGRQRTRTDTVSGFELGLPPDDLLFQRFEQAAWGMLELVGALAQANSRLAASRDLLLPRLISGELSAEAAERQLEAAE